MKKITFLVASMLCTVATMMAQETRTIYLDANIWETGGAIYAVHVWNTGDTDAADYSMTKVEGTIYKADIRSDATSAIFLRNNPDGTGTGFWDNEWNRSQTGIPTDKDLYKITAWHENEADDKSPSAGEWSVYKASDNQGGDTPDPEPTKQIVISFEKPATWTTVKAHLWNGSGKSTTWPGLDMQDNNNGWYCVSVDDDYTTVIFHDTEDADNRRATDNLSGAGCYKANTTAATGGGVGLDKQATCAITECAAVAPPVVTDIVIKVQKPAGWADLNIWAWGSADATFMAQFTAWPGVAMTKLGQNWYSFTVKSDATFMFNDGTNKTQATTKDADACFTITNETEKDGEGNDEYKLADTDCSNATALQNIASTSVTVQPTIVRDMLNISAEATIENISIINVAGQQVAAQTVGANSTTINVSNLTAGMYIVRINTTEGLQTVQNIIKQ